MLLEDTSRRYTRKNYHVYDLNQGWAPSVLSVIIIIIITFMLNNLTSVISNAMAGTVSLWWGMHDLQWLQFHLVSNSAGIPVQKMLVSVNLLHLLNQHRSDRKTGKFSHYPSVLLFFLIFCQLICWYSRWLICYSISAAANLQTP